MGSEKTDESEVRTLVIPPGSSDRKRLTRVPLSPMVVSYRPTVPEKEPAARSPDRSGVNASVEMIPGRPVSRGRRGHRAVKENSPFCPDLLLRVGEVCTRKPSLPGRPTSRISMAFSKPQYSLRRGIS